MTSPFSVLSLSVSRHRKRHVHHVRRLYIRWRDWWPTTSSSTTRASVASIATPNSVWGPMLRCRGSSTANHTSSSSSRVKGTTTRASDASSIRSFGPPRMRRASPRRHNPQHISPPLANDDDPLYTLPMSTDTHIHTYTANKHLSQAHHDITPQSQIYHHVIGLISFPFLFVLYFLFYFNFVLPPYLLCLV